MPAFIVDAKPDDFETILKAAEETRPGLLLVLFLSDLVATMGQSWCPDCVKAEPIIYQQVNDNDKPVTLCASVRGQQGGMANTGALAAKGQTVEAKWVPTLIWWKNGAIASRLEDYEADNYKKIKRLMKMGARLRASSMSSSTSQSVNNSPR